MTRDSSAEDFPLPIYVITRYPRDYPNSCVVRVHRGLRVDPRPHAVTMTLESARATIPEGLVRIERHPDDDPVIVECWF